MCVCLWVFLGVFLVLFCLVGRLVLFGLVFFTSSRIRKKFISLHSEHNSLLYKIQSMLYFII